VAADVELVWLIVAEAASWFRALGILAIVIEYIDFLDVSGCF